MASTTNVPPLTLLLLLILCTSATRTTAIPTGTMDRVLSLLRINGHSLFANAIATSDVLFDVLSLSSFTLLSPPDPHLFALDMTYSPLSYLYSLRLHVVPNFSFPLLHRLPHNNSSPLLLHTLLPSRDLQVIRGLDGVVRVNGVEVVFPRLYHSLEVSVYRLRGVLPADYSAGAVAAPPPTAAAPVQRTSTVTPPLLQKFNVTPSTDVDRANRTGFPPVNRSVTVSSPVPMNRPVPAAPRRRRRPPPPLDLVNQTIISPEVLPVNSTVTFPPVPAIPAVPFPPVIDVRVLDAPAAAPGPGPGRSPEESLRTPVGRGRGAAEPTVVVKRDGMVGECGPLDGERRMQCEASDDHDEGGVRHVSFREFDYAFRDDTTTDYSL